MSKKELATELAKMDARAIKMAGGNTRKGRAALAQALKYFWVQDIITDGLYQALEGYLPGEKE